MWMRRLFYTHHVSRSLAPLMRAVALSSGLPPASAPAHGELHLLLVDLREAAAAERGLRCYLSLDEIERVARFQSEAARSRFVLTRGWLRVILARGLSATPERLTFSYGTNGKPALAEEWRRSELSFNVSHSEDYALIGLTTGRAIGVDIEQVRPMPDFAAIASGYFSAIEMRAIAALPEADRLRGFFKCWTRKEAFMKATGDGMAIALDGFSVSLDDAEPSIAISDSRLPHGDAWTVTGLSLLPECEAAVAVQGSAMRVSAWRDPVRI
jgi:4'-phosphopantetheinyl transferase